MGGFLVSIILDGIIEDVSHDDAHIVFTRYEDRDSKIELRFNGETLPMLIMIS